MESTNAIISGCGFHHVAIKSGHFEKSVKFYTEILGFKEKAAWGHEDKRGTLLDTGDGNYIEIFAGGSKEPLPKGAIIHFALRTSELDSVVERVRKAGAEIIMEPKNVELKSNPPIPIRIAFCKGPDGEEIEFFQNEMT